MGRKTKPTKLKIISGTAQNCRLPKNEPQPKPIAPVCPEVLDFGAKREWFRLSAELEALGILTRLDMVAFAVYCQLWSRQEKLFEKIHAREAELEIEKDLEEQAILSKEISTMWVETRRLLCVLRSYVSELGLSASSRGKIDVTPLENDEWSEFKN